MLCHARRTALPASAATLPCNRPQGPRSNHLALHKTQQFKPSLPCGPRKCPVTCSAAVSEPIAKQASETLKGNATTACIVGGSIAGMLLAAAAAPSFDEVIFSLGMHVSMGCAYLSPSG